MNPLSSRVTKQYAVGTGFKSPETSRTSRAVLPGFAQQFGGGTMNIVAMENVSVSCSIMPLTAATSTTVKAQQGLQVISNVSPASTDIGQAIFSNVSATQVPNIILGHPQIQIVTRQGTPIGGSLQGGQDYTNLALSVSVTAYAVTNTTATFTNVSATVMLLGTAAGNQT